MKFVLGIAIGAIGMWAYRGGKLQGLMGGAPESVQQAWQPAVERVKQIAGSEPVRQAASSIQSSMQPTAPAPEIAKPTAAEVSGRPSEPLPASGA